MRARWRASWRPRALHLSSFAANLAKNLQGVRCPQSKCRRERERAEAFRKRVLDVSVFLQRIGLREPPAGGGRPLKIAYQDACHLANAQCVRREPRALLRSIPNAELCELADAHLCCGSAGTYNLDQPEIADSLGEKKARAVIATGADVVASGNIGCLTQLRVHLAKLGSPIQVHHTMQVLRDAYAGPESGDG